MKYIFFGTPKFAAAVLEKLIAAGLPPAAVVCNPDKPVGRKKVISAPPVKEIAEKHGIKILQPEKLEVNSLKLQVGEVDFFVVAAYSKILKKEILSIPRLGTVGVHPSLLPKHRGASPIQSSILEGDTESGVTLFLIDEKVDHGQIIANLKLKTENLKLNYLELQKKLAEVSGDLLAETLPKFLSGKITPKEQNEAEATYTKKFSTEDAYVEPSDLEKAQSGANPIIAESIDRKIRALNPEPGVWTIHDGERLKLLESETKNGALHIRKFQRAGKKPQSGIL